MNKAIKMFMAAAIQHIDYRIDWKILERVNDGQSMMSRIAGYYVSNKRK